MNKFTDKQVIEIRKLAQRGTLYSEIAKDFNCSQSLISLICRGLGYKDVGGPIQSSYVKRNFTDRQVIEIRERAERGISYYSIANDFKCSIALISQICRGINYKDVGGPIQPPYLSCIAKLTKEQVTEILARYESGLATQGNLAEEFNVSRACIYNVLSGRTYKNLDRIRK
jgi:transcriptional regulator